LLTNELEKLPTPEHEKLSKLEDTIIQRIPPEKMLSKQKKRKCSLCADFKKLMENVHEGKRKHECSICNARYSGRNVLNQHIQFAHEGKKFRCSMCNDAEYTLKSNLYHHIKRVHEGKKYECTICIVI
jgi:hypothetical protein